MKRTGVRTRPHIYALRVIPGWMCEHFESSGRFFMGFGLTPAKAYADWLRTVLENT